MNSRDRIPTRGAARRLGGTLGTVLAGLILLQLGRPGPVQAQRGDGTLIQEFIDRNAEMIQEARIQIDNSGSPAARRVLGEATVLNSRAQALLAQGRFELALQTARRSRAAVLLAVRLSREDMSFHERYLILEERVLELQAILLERATEGGNQAALDILARAEQQRRQAQDRFVQGDAKLAFQLLESVEQMQNRASRLVSETWSPQRLDAEIERIQKAINEAREDAREDAAGSLEAQSAALLEEAENALTRAVHARDEGRPGRAQAFLILARRLVARSEHPADPSPDPSVVQDQIDRWDQRAQGITADAGGSGSLGDFLERARLHRTRAGESLAKGENLIALQQIKVAHDLLDLLEDN